MKSHFNAFAETVAASPELGHIIKYYCGTLVFVPAKMEKHFKGFSSSCLENFSRRAPDIGSGAPRSCTAVVHRGQKILH